MRKKKESDPQVIELDDLDRKRFWTMMLILVALGAVIYGVGQLMALTDKSLDQVAELTDRLETLSVPADASPSEPPKT